jgi:methylated-DNA-[protein]-cysteine S-methyltransferase
MDPMNDIARALKETAPADASGEALVGLANRAADARVLDVAYSSVDSPLGKLTVAGTQRGLVRVSFPSEPEEAVVENLADRLSPRVLEAPSRLDEIRRELDEYFQGRRTEFELSIDWSLTSGFYRKVLHATNRIRYGNVRTYSEVAASAGSPRAVRAAGSALGSNPMPIVVPCHRVLRTGGGLGGYGGGLEVKEYLLRLEGALPGD